MENARKVISDINNDLRALNVDDRFSSRYILNKLNGKVRTMLKQDVDGRRVLKTTELWLPIHCIELCDGDISECGCDIPTLKSLRKSRKRLPEALQTGYGNMLKVFNINFSGEYKMTTFQEYRDIKNREYVNPSVRYFILSDGFLFIPDSEVESVRALGIFKNPHEVAKFNDPQTCAKPLDAIFVCPDYLLDIVKAEVVKELAGVTKRIPEDERPDLNSNNKN